MPPPLAAANANAASSCLVDLRGKFRVGVTFGIRLRVSGQLRPIFEQCNHRICDSPGSDPSAWTLEYGFFPVAIDGEDVGFPDPRPGDREGGVHRGRGRGKHVRPDPSVRVRRRRQTVIHLESVVPEWNRFPQENTSRAKNLGEYVKVKDMEILKIPKLENITKMVQLAYIKVLCTKEILFLEDPQMNHLPIEREELDNKRLK